jgi:hypothetical protein
MSMFEVIPDLCSVSSKIVVMTMATIDGLKIGSWIWFPTWQSPGDMFVFFLVYIIENLRPYFCFKKDRFYNNNNNNNFIIIIDCFILFM